MPKKAIFTKEKILQKAFELMEKKGLDEVTARNLAKALKSSPAPIYGYFKSMEEVKDELIKRAKELFMEYVTRESTDLPFLSIGIGIATFARDEKELFRTIFLREDSYHGLLSEFKEIIQEEIKSDDRFANLHEEAQDVLIIDCWTYAHGLATLICTGYFEGTDEFIRERLMVGAATIIYKKINDLKAEQEELEAGK